MSAVQLKELDGDSPMNKGKPLRKTQSAATKQEQVAPLGLDLPKQNSSKEPSKQVM